MFRAIRFAVLFRIAWIVSNAKPVAANALPCGESMMKGATARAAAPNQSKQIAKHLRAFPMMTLWLFLIPPICWMF